MIAPACKHARRIKSGLSKSGAQRYKCKDCGIRFTEDTETLGGMRIGIDRAEMIIKLLCEGTSVRVASRITGTRIGTILDLLVLIGQRCERYMQDHIRNVIVDDVQCDEVWQFIFCKEKTRERKGYGSETGDSYLFTAIERNTKLLICWHLGKRDPYCTEKFAEKMRTAIGSRRFHLSTDGYGPYKTALPFALAGRIDYGQVVKIFGSTSVDDQRKFSPAKISGMKKEAIWGQPQEDRICTSHIERHNLTLRTFIRRMGRLTCAFSKKWRNHEAMVALGVFHYNYCRVHSTIKTTPCVANGLEFEPWTVRQLIQRTSTF